MRSRPIWYDRDLELMQLPGLLGLVALAVLNALDPTLGGVVAMEGKMIDRPVILKAQRILAAAALWKC